MFHTEGGPAASLSEVMRRSGRWFDPDVVRAFRSVAAGEAFWTSLAAPDLDRAILALEPARHAVALDDDYLDDIAVGFGQVIDAKSPYTAGHSGRVADIAYALAERLDVAPERRRWLRRGALLHDLGKLGVSNAILDKPGKLDAEEWALMRAHAAQTQAILSRIEAFAELAQVSAAHHERLDGKGYRSACAMRRSAWRRASSPPPTSTTPLPPTAPTAARCRRTTRWGSWRAWSAKRSTRAASRR